MTASRPNPHLPAAEAVLTPLQARVARDIVSLVRRENRKAGDHLVESNLARDIGTSRSPVNAALRYLACWAGPTPAVLADRLRRFEDAGPPEEVLTDANLAEAYGLGTLHPHEPDTRVLDDHAPE